MKHQITYENVTKKIKAKVYIDEYKVPTEFIIEYYLGDYLAKTEKIYNIQQAENKAYEFIDGWF